MGELSDHLATLLKYRVAAVALRADPVWLWRPDATRLLWANAAAAAALGAESPAVLGDRRFDPRDPVFAQIVRLGATLYPSGVASLHRLRGFGAPLGRPLLCACTRLAVEGGAAVLVSAREPVGPRLALAERLRRLLDGVDAPLAAFTPAGALLAANAAGAARLAGATTLAAIGADALSPAALADGTASGDTPLGRAEIVKLGGDAEPVLLVQLPPAAVTVVPAGPAAVVSEQPAPEQPASELPAAEPPAVEPPVPEQPATEQPAAAEAPPHDRHDDEAAWWADASADQSADESAEVSVEAIVEPPADQPVASRMSEAAADTSAPPLLRIDMPLDDRRYPLRFVWQMDAEGRFTLGSDEFTQAIGPRVALALGRPWREISDHLGLDPEGRVMRAVETHDTWSGITVSFPVDGSEERLRVELSGLPVYDRNRTYLGYRGFGVCRDIGRLAVLGRTRRSPLFTMSEPPLAPAPAAAPDRPATPALRDSADAPPVPPDSLAPENVAPENVVRFPALGDPRVPAGGSVLSAGEHNAFREIARQLQARLAGDAGPDAPLAADPDDGLQPLLPGLLPDETPKPRRDQPTMLLDRLPVGLLIYRFDELLYANRAFLETTGYPDLAALAAAGGLDSLFVAGDSDLATAPDPHGQSLAILTRRGDRKPVAARLFSIPWDGETAFVLALAPGGDERSKAGELALRRAEATIRELHAMLDTAFDGVVVLAADGRIVSANHSADVLFGAEAGSLAGAPFEGLFAPASRGVVHDVFSRVRRTGRLTVEGGREVTGLVHNGGAIPLFMTMGPMADGSDRLCAVFRDLTPTGLPRDTRLAAPPAPRRDEAGGDTAVTKADFVAKLGHGLRTPLTAIVGFAELMLEERYGPVGNERYREYLRDMRAAADQMAGLIDDTLELSRAENGALELTFVAVDLNDIVQAAVKTMQPQANRERIIIRSSLAPRMPTIVADTRSLHQIILNLLANAIRLTGPGGQVIVSTGQNPQGQVVLRVRDTGTGMSGKDLEIALQPFAQVATASPAGTDLGLPLTKALAEANRGTFAITSRINDGTLVEVTFPRPKIPAE
ncbi:MAG: PAS domain-containing protein [Rhodoplanes sp.]|uniref:PAS domain-containing sensor histidine kinase n=1 Tax=Rhodoplanes sp. TaxID=1968906 RepID=UPI0017D85248|nr:ATP-binding protein [Rhodoplanes sp.]NVO17980.1 PAS domain-containing protein [Rhodoplanes sp.]